MDVDVVLVGKGEEEEGAEVSLNFSRLRGEEGGASGGGSFRIVVVLKETTA